MKRIEKHIARILFSIAILLVFGNNGFAAERVSDKNQAAYVSELQKDNQGSPFIFNEISIGEASHTISQNEYSSGGLVGMFQSGKKVTDVHVSSLFISSYSLKDKRELIFQYLFPFHFFW